MIGKIGGKFLQRSIFSALGRAAYDGADRGLLVRGIADAASVDRADVYAATALSVFMKKQVEAEYNAARGMVLVCPPFAMGARPRKKSCFLYQSTTHGETDENCALTLRIDTTEASRDAVVQGITSMLAMVDAVVGFSQPQRVKRIVGSMPDIINSMALVARDKPPGRGYQSLSEYTPGCFAHCTSSPETRVSQTRSLNFFPSLGCCCCCCLCFSRWKAGRPRGHEAPQESTPQPAAAHPPRRRNSDDERETAASQVGGDPSAETETTSPAKATQSSRTCWRSRSRSTPERSAFPSTTCCKARRASWTTGAVRI